MLIKIDEVAKSLLTLPRSAKQVAAFVGPNPKPRQSVSSVRGVGRISKTGNAK